ncbi:MAG TPA: hypothetical protein VE821_10545, partial [Pyrinomonadaceae bacterium]|nr:hypothetical protein [Pyrinomonadaceae bacterium]
VKSRKRVARLAVGLVRKRASFFRVEGRLALAVDGVCERRDLGADVRAQSAEGGDDCQRDQRGGHGVLGQLKTGFVTKESLNHWFAP